MGAKQELFAWRRGEVGPLRPHQSDSPTERLHRKSRTPKLPIFHIRWTVMIYTTTLIPRVLVHV